MVKAVFFDWFNTLAYYNPPREKLQSQALQQFGIEASPETILPALLKADRYFFEENVNSPISKRNPEEQVEVYARYEGMILTEAGVSFEQDLLLKIMKTTQQLYKGITFVLFDDVISTLRIMKERGLILGLLTNLDKDMNPICHELGLEPYLDLVVTSGEVGADKPNPPIFLTALERAGVSAPEAVHVGDQYAIDVKGARGVGITPILLDRHNLYNEVNDCHRIQCLSELVEYLQ